MQGMFDTVINCTPNTVNVKLITVLTLCMVGVWLSVMACGLWLVACGNAIVVWISTVAK